MQLFIDTANVEQIQHMHTLGVIDGVTTNPSLVAKEGVDFVTRMEEITSIVDSSYSVSAEVTTERAEEMVEEGRRLAQIGPQITIKLPMTKEGLRACSILSKEGYTTNVTLIFSVQQALLAARAGATYVSPFIGRLDDIGQDGMALIRDIRQLFTLHDIPTKIIAASVRHTEHVRGAALAGAHIATVPAAVIEQMIAHPLTDRGIAQFMKDWEESGAKK